MERADFLSNWFPPPEEDEGRKAMRPTHNHSRGEDGPRPPMVQEPGAGTLQLLWPRGLKGWAGMMALPQAALGLTPAKRAIP